MEEISMVAAWFSRWQVGAGGFDVVPEPWLLRQAPVELELGLLGMGKTARVWGFNMREKKRRKWRRGLIGNGRRCHLLLGSCGDAEIPLRSGEELACSGSSR
jgi:hypothetical protein